MVSIGTAVESQGLPIHSVNILWSSCEGSASASSRFAYPQGPPQSSGGHAPLPAKQRDRLVREILALEDAPASRSSPRQREAAVKWPDVGARAKQIVGDRILPNLVFVERGEHLF